MKTQSVIGAEKDERSFCTTCVPGWLVVAYRGLWMLMVAWALTHIVLACKNSEYLGMYVPPPLNLQ